MDANFWHAKWEKREIGFHLDQVNPLLVDHFAALALPPGSRILLPLCGKTRDIAWLLSAGYRVVGVELSRLAVDELFAELGQVPTVSEAGALTRLAADELEVFVGDFFALDAAVLGTVDAVYDRAALVALPEAMRSRYADQVVALSGGVAQLLISYEYDQSVQPGPPFAVSGEEVDQRYGGQFAISRLASVEIPGGLRGKCPATEHVWHLTPRR